jgi:endonuclease I
MKSCRCAFGAVLSCLLVAASPAALAQYVSLVGGTAPVQDFDGLAASGTSNQLPDGWYLAESDSNADDSYAADDGSANSGNTYSYGENESSERALGMLFSGSLAPVVGARLRNDSGAALGEIAVTFTGEQWRLGATGRNDRIAAEYSLDATALDDAGATWIAVPALDFSSPTTTGATGALDGNAAPNRSAVSGSITGLDLAANASLWLRWVDINVSGIDDGLAIDDIAFAVAGDPPPNLAPTVSGVQPVDGASGVPVATGIAVTFSEPVNTAPDAFALTCAEHPIELAESGSGATRTLLPAGVLPFDATCQFTIAAASVQDLTGLFMEADFVSAFTTAGDTSGDYYSQVNTSSPEQLRCSLHATIRSHTVYPYSGEGTNTWTILELAQASAADPAKILDVYRNRLYDAVSDRAGTGSGITYNREHTWPNSLGFPSAFGDMGLPNAPYTDTHMLYLSDTQWNADRGNKPYAYCPQGAGCSERPTEANEGAGGGSGSYPGNSNWTSGNSFETWDERKGDTARAVLYMAIRYEGGTDPLTGQSEPDLELTDDRGLIVGTSDYSHPAYMGRLADLLAWHEADPPDAREIARDEVIYSFQGNRNPFIDHPEWATRALFESQQPDECVLNEGVIFRDGFDGG